MAKYSKGIKIYKLNIVVTNKDSFEECNKEIINRLDQHPELDKEEVKEIKRMIL